MTVYQKLSGFDDYAGHKCCWCGKVFCLFTYRFAVSGHDSESFPICSGCVANNSITPTMIFKKVTADPMIKAMRETLQTLNERR